MLIIEDNRIYLTRGDDAKIRVEIENADGTPYEMASGDTLQLTVRATPTATSTQKIVVFSTTPEIAIAHANTEIDVGAYSADIELQKANGERVTVWPELTGSARTGKVNFRNFVIMPEVTVHAD